MDKDSSLEKNGSDSGSGHLCSDQEREWAQSALSEFNKGNYNGCLQFLSKLEGSCGQDIKLVLNKTIAEYYKSDLKKTDQFRKSINAICSQYHINIDEDSTLYDVENCAVYYNHAVLLYHLKQYNSALRIISKVFTFIEPMEESLAQQVSLLLLELLLVTHQPEKALVQISYIEQQFLSTSNTSVSKHTSEARPVEKSEKNKPEPTDSASESFRQKLLQFRVRCYLKTKQLKSCKRELKNVVLSSGTSLVPALLKGNLEYVRGNYRKAVKVLNSIPQNAILYKDAGESISVLFFNNMGCLHHCMSKPNLACFYLQRALQEDDAALKSVQKTESGESLSGKPLFTLGGSYSLELKYNLGVALLHSGKPLIAFDYLLEAVQVYHMNPRLWLRLAECCIVAHKASNSSDFNFSTRRQDIVQGIIGNGIHKKIILAPHLAKDTTKWEEYSCAIPVVKIEFASLCLRNALLLLNDYSDNLKSGGSFLDQNQSGLRLGAPHLGGLGGSLGIGGLGTLGGPGASLGFGTGAASRVPVQEACYAAPSSPLSSNEVESLRCSALADSAYVALCLGDHVMAVNHAQQLLKQPRLSGAHRLLGHLYAAEGLLMCNRITEAIEHLNPEHIDDVSVVFPGEQSEKEKERDVACETRRPLQSWSPHKVGTAKSVMQYNLAVAFATRGELDKAGETLKQVFVARGPDCEMPIHVVMLALYLELQLGNSEVTRSIVKKHCPQFR